MVCFSLGKMVELMIDWDNTAFLKKFHKNKWPCVSIQLSKNNSMRRWTDMLDWLESEINAKHYSCVLDNDLAFHAKFRYDEDRLRFILAWS
jgi:hypothetical protein